MKKYKETAVIAGITLLVFAGIIWMAASSEKKPKEQANISDAVSKTLVARDSSYDFGAISMAKGKVSNTFVLKNDGSNPVTINSIYTSCMCTSAILISGGNKKGPFGMAGHGFLPRVKEIVPAGGQVEVEVIFDPAAHGPAGVGPIVRVVSLETSDGAIELEFKALVKP